jgi:hypothetical protein
VSRETKVRGGACAWCGDSFEQPATGRPRRYCKDAHKLRAHRERHGSRSFDSSTPAPVEPIDEGPWVALRVKTGLTDSELRRALVHSQEKNKDAAARNRIGRLSITEADRRLFAGDRA